MTQYYILCKLPEKLISAGGKKQTQQKSKNDAYLKDQGWDEGEASKQLVQKI